MLCTQRVVGSIPILSTINGMNKQDRHYRRKRQAAIEYLGGKCVVCGATNNLEFDHVDPSTKEMSISRFLRRRFEVYKAELDKCQLLCYEHHKNKHYAS